MKRYKLEMMSQRIKILITLLASVLVHAALVVVLFFFVSVHTLIPHSKLAPQPGGVVYFNLNPGGEGTGGQGGKGAPKKTIENSHKKQIVKEVKNTNQKKPPQKSIKKIEKKTPQSPIISNKKNTSPDKINQTAKVSTSKNTNINKSTEQKQKKENGSRKNSKHLKQGEGDGEGLQTGPGQGEGKGMGEGEGTGVGSGKGPGGKGKIGSGNPTGQGGEGKKVLRQILRKLNREHRYPVEARRDKIEGKTQFVFKIQIDGSLQYVRIVKSSGHPILDQAALQAVQKAAPFPYYPKEIRYGYRYSLKK